MYTYVYVYLYIYVYVYICICIYIYISIHIYIHVSIHAVYMYIYIYVYEYICINVYLYTCFINTYTRTEDMQIIAARARGTHVFVTDFLSAIVLMFLNLATVYKDAFITSFVY